jgi:hypothetical protein
MLSSGDHFFSNNQIMSWYWSIEETKIFSEREKTTYGQHYKSGIGKNKRQEYWMVGKVL